MQDLSSCDTISDAGQGEVILAERAELAAANSGDLTGDITPYLEAEGARVGELRQAGILELVLLKADQSGAFLLARADDLASARDAIESLPLAAHGLTTVEFTEVIAIDGSTGV